jgi:quinol monooxygenase YgiN
MKAKRGREQELRQVLEGLLAPTRAEDGCINYDLHCNDDDPSEFMFYENWTSRSHLDRHLESPHLSAFKARMDALLDRPLDLTFWRQAP